MNTLEPVFTAVLETSWRASVLIALVLVARRGLHHRAPAQLLFGAWIAIALRLLLPVSVPVAWSPFDYVAWLHATPDAAMNKGATAAPGLTGTTSASVASDERHRSDPASTGANLEPLQWAALIWAGGAIVLIAMRVVACVAFARRLRRPARPVPAAALPGDVTAGMETHGVRILVTDAVSAPALHGIVRPRILFPPGLLATLSPAEIRLTLAHELAHLRRRDLLADLLLHFAVVVHWFNPLAWVAARTARQDCELACDEFVVRRAAEHERQCYGATLLRLATVTGNNPPAPQIGLGVVASKHHIKRRIEMIFRNQTFALPGTLFTGAVFLASIGFSFTSSTSAQVGSAPAVTGQPPAAAAESPALVYDPAVDRLDVLFPSGVVATVLDRTITVADVRREVAPLIPRLRRDSHTQDEFNGRLAILQNSTIKNLVDRALLVRQFHDRRPGEQPKQIAAEHVEKVLTDTLNERFGGDRSQFLEYLRGRDMTLRDYRKELEEQIIYNYMRGQERRVAGTTKATKSNPAERPVRLRIIQLSRSPGEDDASLLAKAEGILARLRNGESFENLAREFDQSGRRDRGGDWGWIGPDDMRPQFLEPFMALKKGDVSAPIVISEGCFLLYAEDRR